MALFLLFHWLCAGLRTGYRDYDAGFTQRFAIERFGRERYGFLDVDLSTGSLAVSNVGEMDSD